MTRKNKIRSAVALGIAGAIAWAAWPGEEVPLRITCTAISPNDSNHVLIILTNRSKNFCYLEQTPSSSVTQMRAKLANGAAKLGWGRIYEWMRPKDGTRYIFSPEMLGNQPAPPASK